MYPGAHKVSLFVGDNVAGPLLVGDVSVFELLLDGGLAGSVPRKAEVVLQVLYVFLNFFGHFVNDGRTSCDGRVELSRQPQFSAI